MKKITAMVNERRQTAEWLLRVFGTGDKKAMLIINKSMMNPILDYCTQFWLQGTVGLIRKLEAI